MEIVWKVGLHYTVLHRLKFYWMNVEIIVFPATNIYFLWRGLKFYWMYVEIIVISSHKSRVAVFPCKKCSGNADMHVHVRICR